MGRKRLTTEEVKGRIEDLTGNEYLLLGNYANAKTKMLVKHILCQNEYKVTWKAFQQGTRCPKCSSKEKLNNEEIDKRMHELIGGEYVRIGKYINSGTKILVKHSLCENTYEVRWNSFQQGARCPKCFGLKKLSNEEIDKVMFELVGIEYIRISRYLNAKTKISIKHNTCGNEYDVKWNDFHQGSRCPKCNESKGEKKISDILNSLGIKYTSQKRFPECKYKNTLPFDFYIHNKKSKLLIEFDGRQHFESIEYFGGEDVLKETQLRDKIKNDFAKEKDIPLLRIPYIDFENIEQILTDKLKELDFI
ncbi:hypothetical protein AM2_117 [Lactococcus phage AM2]|uniref:Uncharacterized protein n=7 Tax=Audreyjarvisvirus AM1 TaxID=2845188 RepID=A0A1W6JLR0_9CAUD|nr:HNH endonuclease [Lactococcus phage AM1]ARM66422.1 hypothetical protein AM2_117 [Lactococcus phage AM2]ARM66599.1 hypothetical protein AM3_117 [Lactococcus phage AM3]ARM67153.1 hypothetical protein AM8_118 [Lactococcus phage AM8]ARM67331.1 hypothetical protein AM9_118 [Lactococcus phage AM9]ARM67510.1 hypothetical protein AM11_118 [Lactococcus phage AM11]ARQ95697.1 hypothetical protein AM12_118 [Lactococcus phage AM12]